MSPAHAAAHSPAISIASMNNLVFIVFILLFDSFFKKWLTLA